jgi:EAL domain-containing protein (putative c-di-GMP-specific phosphodiesterase class I)
MKEHDNLHIAFQPIVSVTKDGVVRYGFEALARCHNGNVPSILIGSRFSEALYAFDYRCRVLALKEAVALGLRGNLSLNITPGAVCHPAYGVDATINVAIEVGFDPQRVVFELTERERVTDYDPLRRCFDRHRQNGVRLALDDFGTGFNNLNTLLDLRPDIVKIDMKFVQKIEGDYDRQALMFGICSGGDRLGMRLIAEGVETLASVQALSTMNIDLMQGFLFSEPAMNRIPSVPSSTCSAVVSLLSSLPNSAKPGNMRGAENCMELSSA